MIFVKCPRCGTVASVLDTMAGKRGRCRKCQMLIEIPGGVRKKCCVCNKDVTHSERAKTEDGKYYCPECLKVTQEAEAASSLDAIYICVRCHGTFGADDVYDDEGKTICKQCWETGGANVGSSGSSPTLICTMCQETFTYDRGFELDGKPYCSKCFKKATKVKKQ